MSLSSLNIATDGLIDNVNSLTIATRGLIQPEAVEEVKVVYPGWHPYPYFKAYKPERKEKKDVYPIHRDDEEVLELIIEAFINGLFY